MHGIIALRFCLIHLIQNLLGIICPLLTVKGVFIVDLAGGTATRNFPVMMKWELLMKLQSILPD
jgi:hypothetical protein